MLKDYIARFLICPGTASLTPSASSLQTLYAAGEKTNIF